MREPVTRFDSRFSRGGEGEAVRITDTAELQRIADAVEAKYGEVWPRKVLAFAKDPHGQTSYRFGRRRACDDRPRWSRPARPSPKQNRR